jgi:hypothetical protein
MALLFSSLPVPALLLVRSKTSRRTSKMPKKLFIPEDANHSGIDITWTKSASRLDIGGWYDSMVGLEPGSFTLKEFFDKLGIKEKDVLKAFQKDK